MSNLVALAYQSPGNTRTTPVPLVDAGLATGLRVFVCVRPTLLPRCCAHDMRFLYDGLSQLLRFDFPGIPPLALLSRVEAFLCSHLLPTPSLDLRLHCFDVSFVSYLILSADIGHSSEDRQALSVSWYRFPNPSVLFMSSFWYLVHMICNLAES